MSRSLKVDIWYDIFFLQNSLNSLWQLFCYSFLQSSGVVYQASDAKLLPTVKLDPFQPNMLLKPQTSYWKDNVMFVLKV